MKITLRETFLILLVLALALGWIVDRNVYYRRHVACQSVVQALYHELRSVSPATQISINVTCSGVETKYGDDEMPLKQ
jgi:hypothetical protein